MRRALTAVLLATTLAVASMAAAHAETPPGLSVSIHDDSNEVRSGDELVYTATVENDGNEDVEGRLVITVPDYIDVTDADGADRAGVDTSWAVLVPAGGAVTRELTGLLGDIPDGEVRVTTLVGLYLGDDTQPTIRSAEADTIAGIDDPAQAASDPVTPAATDPIVWIGVGVGGVVLLAACLTGWLVWRRRTASARREPRGTGR